MPREVAILGEKQEYQTKNIKPSKKHRKRTQTPIITQKHNINKPKNLFI